MDAHYEVTYFMDTGYDVKRVATTVRDEVDIVSCCVLHVPLSCPADGPTVKFHVGLCLLSKVITRRPASADRTARRQFQFRLLANQ